MIALIFVAAALLLAVRPASTTNHRAAAGLGLIAVVVLCIVRQGLPTGYGAAGAAGASLAILAVVLGSRAPLSLDLARFLAGLALLGAAFATAVPGDASHLDVLLAPFGTPWTVVHVVLGTLTTAGALLTAFLASRRLQGEAVILLPIALLLTALPLVGRGAPIWAYADGAPLWVAIPIVDAAGGEGLVRHLPAWITLPGSRELHLVATLVLVIAWLFALARHTARGLAYEMRTLAPEAAVVGAQVLRRAGLQVLELGTSGFLRARLDSAFAWIIIRLHSLVRFIVRSRLWAALPTLVCAALVLRLVATLLPLPLWGSDVSEVASRVVAGELSGTERVGPVALSTVEATGGIGAATIPLVLALVALALVWLAGRPKSDPSKPDPESTAAPETHAAEARAMSFTTGMLGATVATGFAWSNYAWGALVIPDPKLFAALVALGLAALYHWIRRALPTWTRAPSAIALLVLTVLFWSILGPELGWTAPSLHRFGG